MDIGTGTASGMATEVGKRLLEGTIKQVRYLFCFNNIVSEFEEAEINLQLVKSDLEKKVKRAEDNTEEIWQMVKNWLNDTAKILVEVETMKKEIQGKKSCLNGWCPNLGSRYWLGRKAYKKTINMSRLKNDGNFDKVGILASLPGISAPKDFECFRSTTDSFDEIMEALKNDGTHMVILHGMGGVGKTTLAKAASKKVQEENIFKEVVIVTVSQSPNFRNIQGQLADLLNLKLEEETEEGRAKRLLARFSDSNKKLIILDDIWEEFNFEDKIGVPLSKGCKMLLTTRHKNVCTHREYQSLIHLDVLKEHEGVALLKREARIDDDCVNFNTLATRIARECDGLPLALVTTGRYLRGKKDAETWERACEKLEKSKLEDLRLVNSTERSVYASLKLGYDYLKGDEIRLCFLMCSLFPEDFEIPLEDLVRIRVGLDLYKGVSSIEEARGDLRSMVEALKALGLLLDADEKEFVRMHDVVRDVALWITSKGENIFMSKSGMDLMQLSREKGWKQYTAISLLENKLEELSVRLVCPKLKILLFGGKYQQLKVSDECFQEMKALEVLSLRYVDLSLKSLQFLANLKTLVLCGCDLRHISSLAKLKKLEILSFRSSCFDELPIELSELKELRMLDLRDCYQLKRIPSNLIRSFSQLEELYLEDIFTETEDVEKSTETGNAWLSEVNYLSRLAVLFLKIDSKCLPKDFAFSELLRYEIRVNRIHGSSRSLKSSKALQIADIDATLLTALFKALYLSVEYLRLRRVIGCQNILPSIDQKGLKKLNTLKVECCKDLKCMIDASQVGEENPELHPCLAKLELKELPELQCIWKGAKPIHVVNFQSLTDVDVRDCKSLAYLFTLSIARSLGQLKSLSVRDCESLEFLIKIEEGDNGRGEKMLSKLEDLKIGNCERLEYVFPVFVAAGLIQLKNLEIKRAAELKQVFHGKEENEVAEEGKDIKLPNLKNLTLYNLVKLTRFFPENNHSGLPALEKFKMHECPNLTIEERDLEEFQNLHVIVMSDCNSQLCNEILSGLRCGFLKNCEDLTIYDCGVKEVFQLEGQHHELSLPQLERLELDHMEELECLCKGSAHVLRLENLTTLTISRCKKLKHIFPFIVAQRLGQLKSLQVWDCENLEQVICLEENVGSGDEININLPKLKKINIARIDNLKSFCPEKYHLTCPALEEFKINPSFEGSRIVVMNNCSVQLCDEILFRLRCGFFINFEGLNIKNCGVKEVFQLEGQRHELSFPRLKSLELNHLEDLKGLCKGPTHVLRLGNLTTLTISGCDRLTHIFSFTLAQRLGQLESLEVRNCENLEQVVYLEENVGSGDEKNINLPKLKKINFARIDNLKSFCPEKYHLTCPALEEFKINHSGICPALEEIQINRRYEGSRIVVMNDCSVQLSDEILFRLRCGFFKNFEELSIENCGVKEVFQLEGQQHESSLPQLKSLKLNDLEELECLCKGPAHVLRLGNLTTLTISGCYRLTHIFPFTVAQRLGQLESLTVRNCENLEQVFYLDHERAEYVGGGDHKNIVLPNLKYLHLERLAKLVRFFPEKYDGCFPALEEFKIKDCYKLTTSFIGDEEKLRVLHVSDYPSSEKILYQLRCGMYKTLQKLQIENSGIQVIFELGDLLKDGQQQELLLPPNLKNLELHRLKNLTSLTIVHCNKLKHIFSSIVARNHLLQLKELDIRECGELEQIIDAKDGEEVGANLLQTLTYIEVEKCHKLKNLFPISIAPGFRKLERLVVRDNSELEQIFGDNDVIDEKEIQLSQLQVMYLEDLPRLTNFCHVDYHFIFPAPPLVELKVERCPKISTRFSRDEDNKSVHAEAKAPKIGRKDDSHEEQAPEIGSEDGSHEETSINLFCWRHFKKLPPYIKNEELYSNSHPTE